MGGKAALVIVIGFGVLLGIVSRSVSVVATRSQANMSTYAASTESHNIAITGANAGLAKVYLDTTWRGSVTQNLSSAFNGSFTYTVADGAGGRPFLRSVSTVRGPDEVLHDTVEVFFGTTALQSFTLFAWMTNNENGVTWISGDTVWGRVHSNSTMRMSGTPTFMGKLTTTNGLNPTWGTSGNNAVFKQGYETGVAPITFPTDLSKIAAAAASGGKSYSGNITVRLNNGTSSPGDGYALVYSGGTQIDSVGLSDPGFNGVLGSTGRVTVSGTLDGKLSIFSTGEIYIDNSIYYEDKSSTSPDVLGLIAEHNVIVADNSNNASGVEIDGSIFSRSGSFTAENYGSGSPRGALKILGSVVQNIRGAVGTFGGVGILKTGYLKRYRYDDRLADPSFRPPYYPGFFAATYPITSWWESVNIPKFN
jgi:cytoskeletal protein CcmA (bactofilin family)